MKNLLIVLVAIIILPSVSFSQDNSLKDLFTSYENKTDFRLTQSTAGSDISLGLDSDIEKLFNNINDIYVIKYTGNDFKNSDLVNFQNSLDALVEKGDYKPMVEVSGDGVLKVLLKRNGNSEPSEIILIKEDENNALYLWATE